MPNSFAVVVTTINPPTKSLIKVAQSAEKAGAQCIVVGDQKSEPAWQLDGTTYFGIEQQLSDNRIKNLASLIPLNHYARKNLGYLIAFDSGVNWVYETDDDNYLTSTEMIPPSLFSTESDSFIENSGWVNIFDLYVAKTLQSQESSIIWPRGFPLSEISKSVGRQYKTAVKMNKTVPVTSSLVNGDPDVDAIYRLTSKLPFNFPKTQKTYVLGGGTYSPFNSQNTWWHRSVLPLMYLPVTTSFRVTDILRSFVAQAIISKFEMCTRFTGPNAVQERNPHDLMNDFDQELPLYLHSKSLVELLERVASDQYTVNESLLAIYKVLISEGFVQEFELLVLTEWLKLCENVEV
jgi:hypothetical protein